MAFPTAGKGPVNTVPDLTAAAREVQAEIDRKVAQIDACRSLATLAGMPQWPQVLRGLTNHMTALVSTLIMEHNPESIRELQGELRAYRRILAIPGAAEREINDLSIAVERLKARIPA
jgi:hypothetical protein